MPGPPGLGRTLATLLLSLLLSDQGGGLPEAAGGVQPQLAWSPSPPRRQYTFPNQTAITPPKQTHSTIAQTAPPPPALLPPPPRQVASDPSPPAPYSSDSVVFATDGRAQEGAAASGGRSKPYRTVAAARGTSANRGRSAAASSPPTLTATDIKQQQKRQATAVGTFPREVPVVLALHGGGPPAGTPPWDQPAFTDQGGESENTYAQHQQQQHHEESSWGRTVESTALRDPTAVNTSADRPAVLLFLVTSSLLLAYTTTTTSRPDGGSCFFVS